MRGLRPVRSGFQIEFGMTGRETNFKSAMGRSRMFIEGSELRSLWESEFPHQTQALEHWFQPVGTPDLSGC